MIDKLERESWSLDIVMATTLLPKLLYFKNWVDRYSCPCDLNYEEWEEVLDEIIWAFTYISKDYPSLKDLIVEDVDIEFTHKNLQGLNCTHISIKYIEGKTEEDYQLAIVKDNINLARCQQGLNLFAKYYMSLWN